MKPSAVESAGPSEATRDAIRAAIKADLAPVQVLSVGARTARVAMGALLAAGVGIASAPMTLAVIVGARRQQAIAAFAAFVLVVGAIAVGLAPLRGARVGRAARVVLILLFVCGWALYSSTEAHAFVAASALTIGAIGCGIRGFIAGALGGTVALLAWRKTDPWMPRTSGALIGAGIGLVSSSAVHAACSATTGAHLAVGHWLAIPLLALVGALSAKRTLSP